MRPLILGAAAAVALHACAPDAARNDTLAVSDFVSERITIVTRGEGPDIILVPGLASHRNVWAGVADSLDDRYRLHLVQVNGFAGLDPADNADGPVSAPVAEELARYIDETALEQPAVIGHSMGGSIAMMLAARHPESVGRVMVVDMFPYLGTVFAPGATAEEMRQQADTFRAQILADSAGSPTGVLEQMFAGMTRIDSMKPMLMEGLRGTDRQTAANAMHELFLVDLRPELANITAPMSVLYAPPQDASVPDEQLDRAVRESFANVPHARIVRVDDSAHFIFFDQPGQFVAEVDTLMRATRTE